MVLRVPSGHWKSLDILAVVLWEMSSFFCSNGCLCKVRKSYTTAPTLESLIHISQSHEAKLLYPLKSRMYTFRLHVAIGSLIILRILFFVKSQYIVGIRSGRLAYFRVALNLICHVAERCSMRLILLISTTDLYCTPRALFC
jgi:hypothetical protein